MRNQGRVDTPPHSSQHHNSGLNEGANGQGPHHIYANNQAQAASEGMHVFVNSQGDGGVAVNGGKFVAASQQYLQELAKSQASSEYQQELQ